MVVECCRGEGVDGGGGATARGLWQGGWDGAFVRSLLRLGARAPVFFGILRAASLPPPPVRLRRPCRSAAAPAALTASRRVRVTMVRLRGTGQENGRPQGPGPWLPGGRPGGQVCRAVGPAVMWPISHS